MSTALDERQPSALHPRGYLRLECCGRVGLVVSIGAEDQGQFGSVERALPWKTRDVAEVAVVQMAVGRDAEIVSKTITQLSMFESIHR